MRTINSSYRAFCSLLEDPSNLSLSYETLCGRVHVSPVDLNEILLEELGYAGPALLAALRPVQEA